MRLHWFTGLVTAFVLLVRPAFADADAPRDWDALINQPVIVTLLDGRTPRGILSPKSGPDSLVLTTELPGIAIESRFAWRLVQTVEKFPLGELNPLPRPADPIPDDEAPNNEPVNRPAPVGPVFDNAVPPAPLLPEARRPFPISSLSNSELLPVETSQLVPVEVMSEWVAFDPRRAVRSLTIKAEVANWDRDAEVDGLLVRVQPLDGYGNVVPVEGNLDVQLATETKLATGGRLIGDQSIRRDDSFRMTERWSVPIHAIDFDATGTVVKLPFRRFHPERHFDIAPDALAFARLRLPSAGAFDASDPFVLLRPASRFRDDMQLHQNRRLLPVEGPPRW